MGDDSPILQREVVTTSAHRTQLLKVLVLSLLLFVVPDLSAQTSIVVFRTDTAIFAGADSKTSPYDQSAPAVICKFFKSGDLYFGVTGTYFEEYPQVASSAGMTARAIRSSTKKFEKLILPLLQDAFGRMRKEYPARYEAFMHSGLPDVDFIFFGMNRRIPVISVAVFHVQESGTSVTVSLASEQFFDGVHCPRSGDVICGVESGNNKAITAYQSKNPDWWKTKNLASLVRKFVQLEIDAVPAHVGPPIRVLQIDARGRHWIQNGEGCDTDGL
jgi:hypothetical protein